MAELLQAVRDSAKEANLTPADNAALLLAQRYAAQIDLNPNSLDKLGPPLRLILNDLGMTVRGRGTNITEKEANDEPTSNASALARLKAGSLKSKRQNNSA